MLIDILFFYGLILGFMVFFFVLALLIKDNSIVDIAWGLGVVVAAVASLIYFSDIYARKIVITGMAFFWGLRLAVYILIRKHGQGEDYRYQAFRDRWGKYFFIKSLIFIFIFQGTLQLLLVLPILLVNRSSTSIWSFFDFLGLALFLTGFFLYRFLR